MATKAELQDQAKSKASGVKTSSTKKELESKLQSSEGTKEQAKDRAKSETSKNKTSATRAQSETDKNRTRESSSSEVTVNENDNGEATNGTTREGDEDPIKNGEAVKQNGVTKVEVATAGTDNGTEADKSRSEEEVKFADEANPNNKARVTGAGGGEYDQDGNPRTGGKSYGVADDRNEDVSEDVFERNKGKEPARQDLVNAADYLNPEAGSDQDTNNREWEIEDQRKLEKTLSDPNDGVKAVVSTSTGNYVRVKFFRNGLAYGTYTSRNFKEGDAQKYLKELKESRG